MSENLDLSSTEEGLPIIALKNFFHGSQVQKNNVIKAVAEACETVGCFLITDHGVDWSIVENCFRDMNSFFRLPTNEKLKCCNEETLLKDRGYFPFESQNVNAFMGREGFPNDPVEKFAFGPFETPSVAIGQKFFAPNKYPASPITLKQTVDDYYAAMKNLAENLMKIFSACLALPEDHIYQRCNAGVHSLKANFYPKLDGQPKSNQDRLAEHTDATPFTILSLDQNPNSLMIRNVRGEWIYANAPTGAFFVNLGDCMARWTNDRWVATPHKVVIPSKIEENRERLSVVFFVLMNENAIIECIPSCLKRNEIPKYKPISYEQFVTSKMEQLRDSKVY